MTSVVGAPQTADPRSSHRGSIVLLWHGIAEGSLHPYFVFPGRCSWIIVSLRTLKRVLRMRGTGANKWCRFLPLEPLSTVGTYLHPACH